MDNFECLTLQNISKMDINQDVSTPLEFVNYIRWRVFCTYFALLESYCRFYSNRIFPFISFLRVIRHI